MKILFASHLFAPSVGGIETVGRLLAAEFVRAGHEVRVATRTRGETEHSWPILRDPGPGRLLQLTRWADLAFHNNISLRFAWPLLVMRKPWVIAHHTWIARADGTRALPERLKFSLLRRAGNVAVSQAIAGVLPVSASVIPNPYDAEVFYRRKEIPKDHELVFAGRLVSDKGVDTLLKALAILSERGPRPLLTIAGNGPERSVLEGMARELGLRAQVRFAGVHTPVELALLLNRHRVLIVPSRWNEPFGLTALEGIACGCEVIASSGGGLPSAAGECGVTFPNGDAAALARAIEERLLHPRPGPAFAQLAEAHLKKHQPAAAAEAYLNLFARSIACKA